MRFLFLIATFLTLPLSSVTDSATLTLEYDQVGNLTAGYGKYYEYNDSNQLVKVRKDSSSGTVIAEYFYDYQGQRVKKIENGITTYYIGKHYEERKGDVINEVTNYYFANNQKIAKKVKKNYALAKVFYYLNNHLGSADVITDESGNEIDRLRYYPFGEYRTEGKERYSFTGKERDEVTDNYYFEARYYNPTIRRFTQADTVTPDLYDPQSLNRYAYTRNSPLVYTDPSGHFFDVILDIAFIANDIKTLVTDPSSRTLINYVALGADVAGAFIPGATGLGAGVKLAANSKGIAKAGKNIVGEVGERVWKKGGKTSDIWNQSPIKRGNAIESHLAKTDYKDWFNAGQLNNGKFPLIDFQQGNNLVSLKTVDTLGKTWLNRMQQHVIDLGSGRALVDGKQANMILDLRVQAGGSNAAQSLIDFGRQRGVTVIIKEF